MEGGMNAALAVVLVLVGLVVLRRPLKGLLRLLLRMGASLLGLLAFSHVGGLIGVTLGVNLLNALVMAILGVPGFGLLLMLNWTLQM